VKNSEYLKSRDFLKPTTEEFTHSLTELFSSGSSRQTDSSFWAAIDAQYFIPPYRL